MKTKATKLIHYGAIMALALCVFGARSFGGNVYKAYDSESPILVQYLDSDDTATMTVAATTLKVIDDLHTNTITLGGKTIDEVVAAIVACTNSAGTQNFKAKRWAAVGTEYFGTNTLAVTGTAMTYKDWDRTIKWDTSACLTYDAALSSMVGDTVKGGKLQAIYGEPDGTGTLTLYVYIDDDVAFKKTITSPYYITPASWVVTGSDVNITNANTTVNSVTLNEFFPAGFTVGNGKVGWVRATRATTATTGAIGATVTD